MNDIDPHVRQSARRAPRALAPLLALTALLAASGAVAHSESDRRETKKAPDFTLKDSEGTAHSLSDYRGKYVVLEWINFDCPFVHKQYASGAMPYRQEHFRDEDVVWLSVNSSAPGKQGSFTGSELDRRLKKEKWAGSAYLLDPDGKVGRAYGAKTTPHLFIIDPDGNLIYEGGIDSIRSANPDDMYVATNYVVEALTAAWDDRPVPNPTSTPYGCSVKY